MTPAIALIAALCVLIALSAWVSSRKFRYIGEYHLRPCQGNKWKMEFPEATKDSIRMFLRCLADGMDFPEKDKLKFSPNDKLIEIYRSIYGGKTPVSDEMECERFFMGVCEEFKIDSKELTEPFKNEHFTIGEVFRRAQSLKEYYRNEN